MTNSAAQTFVGRCYCGAVSLVLRQTPEHRCYCHCRSCQRASGAPLVAWGTVPVPALSFSAGTPAHIARGDVIRRFCPHCSSPLTYTHAGRPDQVDVCLSLFEPLAALAPTRHIWVSHKLPWFTIGDGLPQFAEWSQ